MTSLERRALALVREYRRQSVATQPRLVRCETPGLHDFDTCHRQHIRAAGSRNPPNGTDLAEWCDVCCEEYSRRQAAATAKGRVLRRIHTLAQRAGEA